MKSFKVENHEWNTQFSLKLNCNPYIKSLNHTHSHTHSLYLTHALSLSPSLVHRHIHMKLEWNWTCHNVILCHEFIFWKLQHKGHNSLLITESNSQSFKSEQYIKFVLHHFWVEISWLPLTFKLIFKELIHYVWLAIRGPFYKVGHTAQRAAPNFWEAFCSVKVGHRHWAQMDRAIYMKNAQLKTFMKSTQDWII